MAASVALFYALMCRFNVTSSHGITVSYSLPRQKTCRERYTSFRKYCLWETKVVNIWEIMWCW